MIVHGYFRSSAAYRLRIALNLKGLAPEARSVHLRRGDQRADAYRALNPQGLVPALETDDGAVLTQSLAIIEWLDETHPEPPLLPADPLGRAQARAFAQVIACDIHPLQNLRVLRYLKAELRPGPGRPRRLVPPLDRAGASPPARRCSPRGPEAPFAFGDAPGPRRDLPRAADVLGRPLRPRPRALSPGSAPCAPAARRCPPSPTPIRRGSPTPRPDRRGPP